MWFPFASLIEREQLTHLGTVGLLLRDIVNLPNIKERNLQSIRSIGCGGAPIGLETLNRTLDVFPKAHLVQVYSQTESGNFISYLSLNQCIREGKSNRLSSVGNPENMVQWGQQVFNVRIMDDSGNDVDQGATGEIVCQGPQTMLGYWNNPEETKKALREGWLHTGDIGRFDEDGYLYLMDRKKDIIIVNGANVYGSEVEEVLTSHPSILEAAVIGTPLADEGEEVTAVVTLALGVDMTITELQHFCTSHLAAFKIPTRLQILEAMPRTSVGKLNKAKLREPFWAGRTRQIN